MLESDVRLIKQAQDGDKEAFTQLVHNYKNFVFRTAALILGDVQEAQDVSQEAFVKAYYSLSKLRDVTTFPSWLKTIVTRLAIDAGKRKKRQAPVDERVMEEDYVEHRVDPIGEIEHRMVLEDGLRRLGEEERVVLVLRELEDQTYQEIADTLSIPVGTVRSRLHSARQHLRRMIQG